MSDLSKTSSYLDIQNGNLLSKTVTYYSAIAPITVVFHKYFKQYNNLNSWTVRKNCVIQKPNYHQNSLLLAKENIKHENEVIDYKNK